MPDEGNIVTSGPNTIAQQVEAFEAELAAQIPPELLETFKAEQARLVAAGLPDDAAQVGSPMPDGELLDVKGNATTLTQTREGRPAVVVFYRGAWCPYCNLALKAYQSDLVPGLTDRNVALIAISPQKPDGSMTSQEANELTFAVLSDPGNQIAGKLGIQIGQSEAARGAQFRLGLDVAASNADGTDALPMPTVVVVDGDGVIRWMDAQPNYSKRTEVDQILTAVDQTLD
jgi:peroxiredoxin